VVHQEPLREVVEEDSDDAVIGEIREQLMKLREPFPPERIEKLPKPKFKDAWKDKRGSNCPICHGYHVLQDAIHLDYVGHANVTDRLLQVDPFWEWEPMAYTPEGTPLFANNGLWIKLTVCGVTRIGYGDGASVKEVIGDAIRNAAMRFGVGLDLWAKIDLHAERNPGDGETSQTARRSQPNSGGRGNGNTQAQPAPADPPRAPNQDALDALASVCDKHGYDRRWAAQQFESDHDIKVTHASAEDILLFADDLIRQATTGPADSADEAGTDAGSGAAAPVDAGSGDDPPGTGDEGMGAGDVRDGTQDAEGLSHDGPLF
jgi:hypothetical protein